MKIGKMFSGNSPFGLLEWVPLHPLQEGGLFMPIQFACASCGQSYTVKDEFAGRTTKCRKCTKPVTVPVPLIAEADTSDALGSLLDEEIGSGPVRLPERNLGKPCPSCGASMPFETPVCKSCGHDLSAGKRPKEPHGDDAPKKKKKKRASGERSNLVLLGRGIGLSAAGAFVGAIAWAFVAVLTHREIGWIAWGVGAAAGAGMSAGYDDKSDGTIPGILAAFIALGGIILGKVFILVWVLYPLLAGNPDDFAFQREAVAGNMAEKVLQQRGIDSEADEAAFDQEYNKAYESLASVSDEEINRRFTAITVEAENRIEAATAPQGDVQASVATDGQSRAVVINPPPADEETPSLVGAFFSLMFGPIDGLFILFAFFTAYKIGSGGSTD
jgi:hypothetical protein